MNTTVYLWLDDIRTPPSDEWIWAISVRQLAKLVKQFERQGNSMVISLDHDLGCDDRGVTNPTGYDFLSGLEYLIHTDKSFRPDIVFNIHSANPVGVQNMRKAIESIYGFLDRARYAEGNDV